MTRITAFVDIDLEDLTVELMKLDHEQLAKFIITLDAQCADWSFTSMMFEYFKGEMQKEEEDN